jgi:alpha-maltose-1-phosphate synthase
MERRVLLLTNEYPPHSYGGAGVHVEYLARELATLTPVEVRTFGREDYQQGTLQVHGLHHDQAWIASAPAPFTSALHALSTCVAFASYPTTVDVVHCHTWYTHFGGILLKLLYGLPLVITVHSLEPLRPWKRDQLGRGYDVSSWLEKTALEMADLIIAVSRSTATEITQLFAVDPATVTVIPNGIDTTEYAPGSAPDCLAPYGIDPTRPYVLFVGRMTLQKGLRYLLAAIPSLVPEAQVVLCAGAADTPQLGQELEAAVTRLQQQRAGIIWIPRMVPRATTIALYSQAAVFCCPSIYEPFGLINLEAMACATPVVASAVGGIPEVVVEGETGYLVDPDLSSDPPYEPRDPPQFAQRLAEALNRVLADPVRGHRMGQQGRARVEQYYSWRAVAQQTLAQYRRLPRGPAGR